MAVNSNLENYLVDSYDSYYCIYDLFEFYMKQDDWQQREQELLKKIDELEKVKTEKSEDGLRLELKVSYFS